MCPDRTLSNLTAVCSRRPQASGLVQGLTTSGADEIAQRSAPTASAASSLDALPKRSS